MNTAFVITALVYLVAGALPPILALVLLRTTFLGGAWGATIVGILGAVIAGVVDALFLSAAGDLLVIAGAVDLAPPLIGALVFTVLFALVSSSNRS